MNWLASYFEIGLSVGALVLHILNKGCASSFKYHHTGLLYVRNKHLYTYLWYEQVRIENLTTHEIHGYEIISHVLFN